MGQTIVFTGGGTAGHVFPGIAVAEELRKIWHGEIVWIGSKTGMERKLVENAGITYRGISAGKLRRYISLKNFADLFRVAAGVLQSRSVLKELKPSVLFSKGGFVSVPPVRGAAKLGIPIITHESDTDPGLATRMNARYARIVCTAFPETAGFLKEEHAGKVLVTGNPVRAEILRGDPAKGREFLGAPKSGKIITVIGGSQGAQQINLLIADIIDKLVPNYFVVHQMGQAGFVPSDREGYKTFDFISGDLPHIFAASDLIISRAGANSLAEISVLKKPSILIPLMKGAGRGDQVKNAELYAERGAAAVLIGDEATPKNLLGKIGELLGDPAKSARMARAASELSPVDAARRIAVEIQKLAENSGAS
jgi:UDP-N-acetylglucosamine--N-acetylmuramyl-(pentapeptide) pyrophosphoryl-undecaprenol N-acetylglucosamine transferase